ncbi:MAG: hypothetical protein ACTSWA_13770, partial [Candidatus Thorarchaeota archaeon]
YNNMRLHALGLVDASNIDRFVWQPLGGSLSGEELVFEVRSEFVELFGGVIEEEPTDTFNMTATVVSMAFDTVDSQQHVILGTDNATYPYIEGARAWMNQTDWYTLLLEIGVTDSFTATIQKVGDVYRIVAIVKN